MAMKLKGIAASNGYAMGKAFILQEPILDIKKSKVTNINEEISRLGVALDKAKSELEEIKERTKEQLGIDKAEIFSAHLLVLNDPELITPVKDKIQGEQVNAEFALNEVAEMFITMFEQMDNEYMKERASDIKDVTKRVIAHLLGLEYSNPSGISEKVILVAKDLTPSDTAQLNKELVLGFTTDVGGRTSHSAIMARSLEIPAVVGTKEATSKINHNDFIIIDGIDGIIMINPTNDEINEYEKKQEQYIKQKQEWAKLVNEPTLTKDNIQVELAANIGTPEDVKGVLENGGEAIGLYRTEFLYMGKSQLPTEEEQFEVYKAVIANMEGRPVVVRTLDIGGDKELPYLNLPKELNPFLGFRAIRLTLERQDIFRTQLRALLRSSIFGRLRIMFPMIATVSEFLQAKGILIEEKERLQSNGFKVAEDIEIGMMVEIPSTAVLADQFAKHVDFFSIGTNDLIQYTMAADRMNEKVAYLYQPYNPAILRLINMVIKAAHENGKWVGMCGEMAGDPIAIPILLGFGLDEFSMSATSILPARAQISNIRSTDAKEASHHALSLETTEEVITYMKGKFTI